MRTLTFNIIIISLVIAGYVFAGGFEEDPGPEELIIEGNTESNNEFEAVDSENNASIDVVDAIEDDTPSLTDNEGNIVTWSKGLVTAGGDGKNYVTWGN